MSQTRGLLKAKPMTYTALIAGIAEKGADKEAIARELIRARADLTALVEGMSAKPAAVKFGCQKVLRIISERDPALAYPCFERIAAFLDSKNSILKWGAILILANLSAVDAERRFVALFERYYRLISGPEMIAAANVIASSPKIARAYPELADRIKDEILKVQKARYKTRECRNVAIGHALTALKSFYDLITERQAVLDFVRKQLKNPRKPVAEKARKLIRALSRNGR